jgi:hypothetical protein
MASPLLHNCHGARPSEVFEEFFPGGIADLAVASEARRIAVGARSGHMFLLDQSGLRITEDRTFADIRLVRLSATADIGACVVSGNRLICFNQHLKKLWDVSVTGNIAGLAVSPYGSHIAFSTEMNRLHVVSVDRREVFMVDTRRPMEHLEFLAEHSHLIAAAEFGQICRFDLKGRELWNENLIANAGAMSVAEGPGRIFLAAFNHGVQVYDLDGNQLGTFAVDGIPAKVSAARTRSRIAALTLENRVYWLNFEGTIQWAADISNDPPQHICTGPLGDRLLIGTQSGCLLQVSWP